MFHFLAWATLVLSGLAVVLGPLMLGKDRGEFTYANWIGSVLTFLMLAPLCYFVLTH